MYKEAKIMTDETNKYPEWMHQFFIKTNGSCLQKLKKDNEKVIIEKLTNYVINLVYFN